MADLTPDVARYTLLESGTGNLIESDSAVSQWLIDEKDNKFVGLIGHVKKRVMSIFASKNVSDVTVDKTDVARTYSIHCTVMCKLNESVIEWNGIFSKRTKQTDEETGETYYTEVILETFSALSDANFITKLNSNF